MNERIIKLITEADTHAWTVAEKYVARDCCNDGEVNYLWEDAFRGKFAELIVKECAHRSYLEDSGNSEVEEALEFWRKDMLKHFGVEE